ncbi:hypothetical protein BZA77DRAFT_330124 [Pyronema omphalodes]|nr:hypothetical protein BZA77DRAFT_330124 [Pyronema omphalodes]
MLLLPILSLALIDSSYIFVSALPQPKGSTISSTSAGSTAFTASTSNDNGAEKRRMLIIFGYCCAGIAAVAIIHCIYRYIKYSNNKGRKKEAEKLISDQNNQFTEDQWQDRNWDTLVSITRESRSQRRKEDQESSNRSRTRRPEIHHRQSQETLPLYTAGYFTKPTIPELTPLNTLNPPASPLPSYASSPTSIYSTNMYPPSSPYFGEASRSPLLASPHGHWGNDQLEMGLQNSFRNAVRVKREEPETGIARSRTWRHLNDGEATIVLAVPALVVSRAGGSAE